MKTFFYKGPRHGELIDLSEQCIGHVIVSQRPDAMHWLHPKIVWPKGASWFQKLLIWMSDLKPEIDFRFTDLVIETNYYLQYVGREGWPVMFVDGKLIPEDVDEVMFLIRKFKIPGVNPEVPYQWGPR